MISCWHPMPVSWEWTKRGCTSKAADPRTGHFCSSNVRPVQGSLGSGRSCSSSKEAAESDWADDDGMTGDSIAKTPGEAAKIIAEAVEEFSSPEGGRLILSALTHVTDKIIADMIHLSKRRGMPDSEIGDLLFIRGPDDEKATWYGCRDGMWTVNGEGAISMAFEPLDRLEQAIRDANEKHGRFAKKLQPNINKLLTAIGRSQSRVAALKILSENMTYKSESKFDSNRGIIPFKNGYVADGAAKTIRKAVPKDLIRTTLDIPYVPELFESEYLQFLFEHHYWNVFSHRTDTGTFFLVYVRHAAFGNPGKKIFILYGDGNDGKSGLIVLFSEALSPLFGSLEPSILMTAGNKSQNAEGPKSELKRLAKLRCAMGSEAMSGSRWDVGSVKAITSGGDKKPVRGCYDKTPEDVVLNTLLVQAINPEELPAITRAESIRNRFLGINMLSKYVNPGEEDEDNHVFPIDQEFMSTAAKGLLRYAVVARIIKDQFASEDVSMPSVPRGVLAATEELFPPPKSESLTRSILSQCKFTGKIEDGVPYEKALQLADSGEKMMSKASVFGRLSNVFYRGFRPRASHDKYRYGKDMDKHGFPGWVVDASVAAATESENREFDIASIAKTMVDAYPDRFKYAFGHDGSAAGENREEKSAPVRTYTQAELDRIEASRLELIRFVEARRDDGGRDKLTREMRTPVYAMARMKENHDAAQEEIDFGEGML
ncbi:hypothetical protein DFJ74DRAFT_690373, partial [Hyaloraphidium curvatum]